MNDVKVSIVCNTYNQEDYIADALDGFLMQKTEFKFEVLVHDDASTDGTADIIRRYEKKYPDIIKPIYQKENQYSKKISVSRTYQYPRAKGRYIALCEGDDYWTDPLKLQKQFNAMEANPSINLCAHAAVMIEADTKKKMKDIAPSDKDAVLSVEDVIVKDGECFATNSLFFRSELIKSVPEFVKTYFIDYSLQIQGALPNGVLYLKDNMSAYRRAAQNSWTSRMRADESRVIRHINRIIDMLKALDEETSYIYTEAVQKSILKYEFALLEETGRFKEAKADKYKQIRKEWKKSKLAKKWLKHKFPFLLKIKKMLKSI